MSSSSRLVLVLVLMASTTALAANMDLVFCVLSEAELAKCEAMAEAVMAAQDNDDNTFGSYFHKIRSVTKRYSCRNASKLYRSVKVMAEHTQVTRS